MLARAGTGGRQSIHGLHVGVAQEQIIGRKKFTNTLCTITQDGVEHDILRDNMPFARPALKEYGTYFIGYSRHLWVIEQMLERMFIGSPPPLHDRILDLRASRDRASFDS